MSTVSRDSRNGQKLLPGARTETVVLSDQHRIFVTTYLKTGNASEAARQAGFNWPGQKGAKLLKTAKIRAAINAQVKPHYPVSRNHVFAALSQLAYANLGDFLDDHGQPIVANIRTKGHLVKKYKARVIRSLSTDQVTVTDVHVELYDRLKTLVTIGKMLGMFSSTVQVDRMVDKFFELLDEALLKFVPAETRRPAADFLRKRFTAELDTKHSVF